MTKRYKVEFTLAELHAAQQATEGYIGLRLRPSPAQRRAEQLLCDAISLARLDQPSGELR